jgi:hypothetical protein
VRTLAGARPPDDRIGEETGGLRLPVASGVMAEPETPAVAGRSVTTGVLPAGERVAVSAGQTEAGTGVLEAVPSVRASEVVPC